MKKTIIILLTGLGVICSCKTIDAKEFREKMTREFTLTGEAAQSTLYVYNFSGFIKVEGYSGNKVILDMDKTISADSDSDLEKGKKEFALGYDQSGDSITVYISEPFDTRPRRNRYSFNEDDPGYEFNVNFTVRVPSGMNLHISTITEGDIEVQNVGGELHVNNVNAGISILNARAKTRAHTVNGDVSVTYVTNPPDGSSYQTINGDIHVSYRPDFSADITFKSMNGDLYTDFPEAQLLAVPPTKIQEKRDGKMVYRLNNLTTVRFGKGGRSMKFETLNGNVYIKKQS